jgi:hypothetical protein
MLSIDVVYRRSEPAGLFVSESARAPHVVLQATHESMLKNVLLNYAPLSALKRYAPDLN